MKRLLLGWALLLSLAVPAAGAAQELAVVVKVQHDGSAVSQASVSLGARTLLTDSAGQASFRVPSGRYELRAQRVGLATLTATVAISRDTTITLTLQEEALEAEEIIVLSTRGERRVQDEPVKVEVVSREEVEEKLLMTPGSISMLLNETSGLRVQETAPALGGAVIRVQGLSGRYTQLLSDGLPLYGGQAGSLGILQIPPIDLAQVEVIKGAASALYGALALGGAIDLIPRRPADETELLLNQTSRGGSDVVLWNARQLGERAGFTTLLSGHLQETEDVDEDGWADVAHYRRLVARPRLFLTGESGGRAMLTAGLMLESRRGGGSVPAGPDFLQELDTRRFDAGLTARRPISSGMHLDVRGSISLAHHDHRFGDTRERDDHNTAFGEALFRGQHGKHYWVAGAALQRDSYAAQDVAGFDYSYWIPSVFAQDEISFSDRFVGSFSVRVDRHSEYGAFIAPRASTLLRFTDATSLRLSAGRGYFGPTPFTEETEEVGLTRVRPGRALAAETANIFSADFNWSVAPFEANASLFASNVRNAVDASEVANQLELINLAGDTRTHGVELLARYRREPFGVTASYTMVEASEPGLAGGRTDVVLVPRHSAGLVAVYEKHEEGRIGIEMYYTGEQALEANPYRTRSADYFIVGLLVERRIGRVRAFLNMENLTGVRQSNYDPLVRPARSPSGRWTTDVWAPLDGRTFNGGLRIELH